MRTLFIVSFFILFGFVGTAQSTDDQLAAQFFSNNDFEKAADLYEKLLIKNPTSGYYYENLLLCYLSTQKFDVAEKLTKKQQRKYAANYYFKVDQGYVYKKQGLLPQAQKNWEKLIDGISGEPSQAMELSVAFQKRGETDYAITTFEDARKKSNSQFLFSFELARLYADKLETEKMANEYLNALISNQELLDDIQGYLQLYIEKNDDYQIVKTAILRKYKENAGNETLSELLIWLYVQRKDFSSAFIQARALDKRFKEEGQRLLLLANLALQNEAFNEATMIYNYIITLGKDKANYMNAKVGTLNARNSKMLQSAQFTQADLQLLEADYKVFLTEFGRYYFTASVMRDLARLQAYQQNNYDSAIAIFEVLIGMQRLENQFKALCKLELGDIYILKAEEWDAMLLYGQVDKDFKEDPLGQEAKFRNAKLSYYMGEFEWARAQLDVLKTATTQLIANNALELSLLIQDNTLDSVEQPLLLFAKADLYYYQNKTNEAILLLDSIEKEFPRHALADDILMKRAEIATKKGEYIIATTYLKQLLKENGSDILGDNAHFRLAEITETKLGDKLGAQKLYEEFLEKYPGSFFSVEVRKRFRALRGDILN